MSTRICVNCPSCDAIWLAVGDVTLRHCTDDGRWDYWFRCPGCDLRAAGRSNSLQALEACAAGSRLEEWQLPSELAERHAGPPLTLLDLLHFRLAITEPDWFRELDQPRP